MNTFLKTYRLALTPLSPIHIGCGEDFEPTNYVIDDGVLYGFDPSRAVLNALQTAELMAVANRASLLGIQKFFKDNATTFKAQADTLIPVSSGVAAVYEQRVGRAANVEASGNQVFNQLFIERTMHTGRQSQPYVPGSSFKGAIRTAMLDELNRESRPVREDNVQKGTPKLEARLLGHGDEPNKFERSPLRLLKIADLMPAAHCEPARRVMFGVNRKKRQVIKDGREMQPKGIAARKECILHGQFRAFEADAVLPSLDPHTDSKTTPIPALRPADFKTIAKQSNAYNQTRLRREMGVLDGRGLVNPAWKHSIDKLMAGTLGKKLATGEAFLIRLGRYGGAESKTLSGDGVASIKIMGARVDGKQEFSFESTTKTVWLAAEQETDQKHLLPFGWAVVEIDPQEGDSPELKAWCIEQSKGRPDMAQIRQQFEEEKQAALTRKIELAALAAQREAARQAEQLAAIEREQALAEMTEQGRQIETLRHGCEAWVQKMPPHGNFKKQAADPGKAGLFQDASKLVTQALDCDWSANDKAALADMLETWLPQVIAPWDAKEQRKKLKFAALRGAV
jgi:CRISPR-associated protein Csm5